MDKRPIFAFPGRKSESLIWLAFSYFCVAVGVFALARTMGLLSNWVPTSQIGRADEVIGASIAVVLTSMLFRKAAQIRGSGFELLGSEVIVRTWKGEGRRIQSTDFVRVDRNITIRLFPHFSLTLPVPLFKYVLVAHTHNGDVFINADGYPAPERLAAELQTALASG